ncbi:MAG: hypothetical protein ACTSRK_11575 [Promethearchaeota archaeon]
MQEQTHPGSSPEEKKSAFRSTRIKDAPPDLFDPLEPRIGRRESEPHSAEVSYLYDVLSTNFVKDRIMWDLHHYFEADRLYIDLQFDVSFFKGLDIPYSLSSYRATKYQNKVPTLAINILSKSTWRADVGEHVDYCKLLQIPIYVFFPAYHVTSSIYRPPFLRAYILQPSGEYKIRDLREVTLHEGDKSGGEKKENDENIIDLRPILPFRLGLEKLKKKHEGELDLYRMVIIKPEILEIFPTRTEQESVRANQEKERADQEKTRADQAEQKISELKTKLKQLESK